MTQLRKLTRCPFCDPPKWSRRLSKHIHWHHRDEITNGRVMLASDGRLYWNGKVKLKVLKGEIDSLPKVVIEVRKR